MQAKLRELEAEVAQREKQQGLGKPIITADFQGWRLVAVGNRILYSQQWRTFHDFLREFIFHTLGDGWTKEQRAKPPDERHRIMKWFDQAQADAKALATRKDGLITGPMTGAQRAFLNLAYNLYLIAHHSAPAEAEKVIDSFTWRLKSARDDDFVGKLFETYASAAFLKAGFKLEYENERDGSASHVEFVATYPSTGKKFSVEVKSRNRQQDAEGPQDDAKHPNVWRKVQRALKKEAAHDRVVFVEVNVPDVVGDDMENSWVEAAVNQVEAAESYTDKNGDAYPPAYVVVTNHAFHNNLEASDVGIQAVSLGYKHPEFGPRTQVASFREFLEIEERHKEMLALFESLKEHSQIPSTFDGEIPDFAFGGEGQIPRLRIGQTYLVPDEHGVERPAVLEDATVLEADRKCMSIYRLENGQRILASDQLSEVELNAWRAHPETFFGRIKEVPKQPEDWIELASFFYESYRHANKEKLLEFMKDNDDIERLAAMDQKDLAILFCERMAMSAWAQTHSKSEGEDIPS